MTFQALENLFGHFLTPWSSWMCSRVWMLVSCVIETAKLPKRLFGVVWVPLIVPPARRLQTLCVVVVATMLSASLLVFFVSVLSPLAIFAIPYAVWIWSIDKAPETGGRRVKWVRELRLWTHFCEYFPIQLTKTADLNPEETYIFGYHPHGIISIGALGNFGTEATHFSSLFPGITLHLLTLKVQFQLPLFRDILLSLGLCDVGKRSIGHILAKPGNAVCIVIGGAAESLDAKPNSADLTLLHRKGFVKMALVHGSHLVPVFSFGENDLFDQVPNPKGSQVRRLQEGFQKMLSFAPPLFHGRGVFNYNLGMMPHRRQINTVVGEPIAVPKIANPTPDQVDLYHKKYMDGLQNLYDAHKDTLALKREKSMVMK